MMEELRREFQALRQQMGGIQVAMQTGFGDVRKDVSYLGRAYLPLVAVALLALVLSIIALVFALENRNMLLNLGNQTNQNARILERLAPPDDDPGR